MSFILKGNLSARICRDCKEPLIGSTIRFYQVENLEIGVVGVAANPKKTLEVLGDTVIKAKSKLLLAEAEIDEKGNYETVLDDSYQDYGGPLVIDVLTKRVPNQKSEDREPIQFTITTVQPEWREVDNDLIFAWKYCINSRFWCFIRGLFDAWVICGRLLSCLDEKTPIPGVKVIALDADWFTDDELGSGITNSAGYFRIDYTSIDFKQTFLSPIINVETPFPPFNSGPDVYFQLEIGNSRIAIETDADKRDNVGHCLCVELCVDDLDIIPDPIPASFTNFGLLKKIHIQSEINTANGKTLRPGFNDYAFYRTINLIGTISKTLNGNPMEYMFEYQEVAAPTDIPTVGGWQAVVPNMIPKTVIGNLFTLTGDPMNPVDKEPYHINALAPELSISFNGNWIPVPQNSNFEPHQDAEILKLNTVALTGLTSIDMSSPTSAIGAPTVSPARPHLLNRYFAIRMKQREINNAATEVIAGTSKPIAIFNAEYDNVNRHGSWAPKTVNNRVAAVSVDVQEIVSADSDGCSKITTDLNVKYSARNENLKAVSLSIVGPNKPGQSFSFPAIPLMAAPETFGTSQLVFTPAGQTVNDLLPCAYTISLSATVALTNGEGEPNPITDFVSFCKV
ncbi:hypothetical protein [uncultured Aquimarina sp.]|uniref:hypothetical protein n=1 Tax=uncultured Aquimarina sp. TaxID=575652 RepID=UPI0026158B62|nr:hypothetical protein [uncultured Aquimarina sp.]